MGFHPAIRNDVRVEKRDDVFVVVVVENGNKVEFRCRLRGNAELIASAYRSRLMRGSGASLRVVPR